MQKLRQRTIQEVSAYICDRCGREAGIDDAQSAEFISIEHVGGYDSIFGDGAHIALDICQHCLKETLGEWLRIT